MTITFVCAGQSNMDKMMPALVTLFPEYQFLSAAKGATSITQWQRGGGLFGSLLTMTNQAIINGSEVKALLFSQGESDTYDLARALGWKLNFLTFVRDFRVATGLKGLHVVYAQLGAPWGSPYIDVVKGAQASMQTNPILDMVTLDHLAYSEKKPHYADYNVPARMFMGMCRKVCLI